MESKHLSYFKVENFKRFDSLEIKDIGQFNLIVGDNNVGKTTLLEALLFDDENYDQFLANLWNTLAQYRKITIPHGTTINYLDFYLQNKSEPITYSFEYLNTKKRNALSVKERTIDKLTNEEIEKLNGLIRLHTGTKHLAEFSLNNNSELRFITYGADAANFSKYLPFIGYSHIYNDDLTDLFSNIIIVTRKKEEFTADLKYFIPNLLSVETNTVLVPQKTVIVIREADKNIIPLSQYGDGTIKLFRYLIELDYCENKRLMIDEIDTGIHYSRMKDFLKKVLQSAKNKNVQLFATTHSKECIEYYTKALQELGYENDGRIMRIADTKSGIKAYTLNYEQFENSLMAESEIR